MLTVAIIGAGSLGRRLAVAASRAKYRVLLEDVMSANLHQVRKDLRQQLDGEAELRLQFVSTIEDAVRDADLAIDCVPDELESKLEIFCLLDRMAPPRTVLATPTARLSIADLAACTYRSGQCVAIAAEPGELGEGEAGTVLMRITTQTTPATVALVRSFWEGLGFVPRFELDPAATDSSKA